MHVVLEALRSRMRMRQIPGLSLRIARHGELLFSHELGVSDVASGNTLMAAHGFRLGCLTKPLTAQAVLQLAAEGRLDLDDAIGHYVAALAPVEALRNITVAQLLSHTSGLARGPYVAQVPSDADMLRSIATVPLLFTPGTHFKYSNWGYYLLGKVLESVCGQSADACISGRVLSPIEMHDSSFSEGGRRLATGYWNGWYFGCPDISEQSVPSVHTPLPVAAGGLISTASDYLRWLQHTARDSAGPMLVPRYQVGRHHSACFGLFAETVDQVQVFYCSGSSSGFSSYMLLIPSLGIAGVAMCNHGACTGELREMLYLACRATVSALPRFGQTGERHDVLVGNRRGLLRFKEDAGQTAQLLGDAAPIALWRYSRSAYFLCDGPQRRHMLRITGLGRGDAVLTVGAQVFYERLNRLRSVPAVAGLGDTYAGVYHHPVFGKVELICREGQLYLSYGAAYEALLEATDHLCFRQGPGAFCFEIIEFRLDPDTGKPLSFLMNEMLFVRSSMDENGA